MRPYPNYITYRSTNKTPSVLRQTYPAIEKDWEKSGKVIYPRLSSIEEKFTTVQSVRFGAAQFCGFLHDTIGVEHNLVIPAIAAVSCLPVKPPTSVLADLYQAVTDEGHHAMQALVYLDSLVHEFDIRFQETKGQLPKFLRRLETMKRQLEDPADQLLFEVLAGVVTETRVSHELSEFARNPDLIDSVRAICRSHQEDEAIHSSQFRALGKWVWTTLDEPKRSIAAALYAQITIARSLPDADRLAMYIADVGGVSPQHARTIIQNVYTPEVMMAETLFAAKPTLRFLNSLGVVEMDAFKKAYKAYDWTIAAARDAEI